MTFGELKPLPCKRTEATSGLAPLEMAKRNHWTSERKKNYMDTQSQPLSVADNTKIRNIRRHTKCRNPVTFFL
jgi:hypothetical protein